MRADGQTRTEGTERTVWHTGGAGVPGLNGPDPFPRVRQGNFRNTGRTGIPVESHIKNYIGALVGNLTWCIGVCPDTQNARSTLPTTRTPRERCALPGAALGAIGSLVL